ncbi:MAG: beta-ketoacyl synthase N-terminal-like domain-containing protein [Flavipsychrobacter sp.]
MKQVYAIASDIISPMGFGVEEHWQAMLNKELGIKEHHDDSFSAGSFWGSRFDTQQRNRIETATNNFSEISFFEQLVILSAQRATQDNEELLTSEDTLFVLSTTKGNIDWLEQKDDSRTLFSASTDVISKILGLKNKPVVISHACISGAVAQMYALRAIQNGRYKHAVIVGCDVFSKFVLNGFQSFQAVAEAPCKPFDANRKGINLGEAAATVVLSAEAVDKPIAILVSGATSNDANHISGPSRTGEELAMAIKRTLDAGSVSGAEVNMISAHGTATPYNDEMEAKAFGLSDVDKAAVHSFKGYTGHTLGAAGVLECAMLLKAIQEQTLIPSAGFEQIGVPVDLQVTTAPTKATINHVLKTASGFGGCNAALLWSKVDA